MIGTLYIDDLDGAVTLFKSTDEGTETIAVFDEEYREVLQDLLTEIKWLSEENKVLAKYRDIVNKYDNALLVGGDEDPRWSELYVAGGDEDPRWELRKND